MKPRDSSQNVSLTVPPAHRMRHVLPPALTMRSYLSPQYLWAAKHFASKADEIEQQGANADATIFVEHRAYVTGAIFSAVAFLEATVNEFFKDLADEKDTCYSAPIVKEARRSVGILWELTEGRNRSPFSILDKCQLLLTFCGKAALILGEQPYQNANLVIGLRNVLTHYKPETYGGDKQHAFLKQFAGKFGENRLLAGCASSYFPEKCLGSGCADWVVQSVTNLADEFFRRLGISPPYQPSPA